jgi:hypothetical protein
MLTISPFLVIDDNININNRERKKDKARINTSKLERREPKSSMAQTKSIDMSQNTAYSSDKCTYP